MNLPQSAGMLRPTETVIRHAVDGAGYPAGGTARGQGFYVDFQDGPISADNPRNGAFIEDLLTVCQSRLHFYQEARGGKWACEENIQALHHIFQALAQLNKRTKDRKARSVEGTHAV